MLKKIFLSTAMMLALTANCFAAVSKDATVAVMDFGTRPGATPAEININNAEYKLKNIDEMNTYHFPWDYQLHIGLSNMAYENAHTDLAFAVIHLDLHLS